jgi:hypothetical protein
MEVAAMPPRETPAEAWARLRSALQEILEPPARRALELLNRLLAR